MRVILAAMALSALSFVAGVAGDLASRPENSGAAVTLRIPPPIPADAPRARPLPVISTPAATAAEPARVTPLMARHSFASLSPEGPATEETPQKQRQRVLRRTEPKIDARIAAKADEKKGG